MILIFVLVIFLAYYITKILNQRAMNFNKSINFEIIDHIIIGREKSLYIIRIGQEYILIGVSNNSINYIKNINKEDIIINKKNVTFKNSLNMSIEMLKKMSNMYLGGKTRENNKKN